MENTTILIFGGFGQLGQCVQSQFLKESIPFNFIFLNAKDGNVLNKEQLNDLFAFYSPSVIVNCSAYTAVDQAEDEVDAALALNSDGVQNLVNLCKTYQSKLIHISTDFVFKGDQAKPLKETDQTNPINVYGFTKLKGEQCIQDSLSRYFIIRTSWLYSEFGNNFVKTMLRLSKTKDELGVIWDQVGTPTYAMDLAQVIINCIKNENQNYGLYHYSNEGVASWYDFAHEIFVQSGIKIKLNAIKTEDYVTKATRPSYSVMDKSKIKKSLQIAIPHWKDSLVECLKNLNQSK
jgi:dTDP-4-dehydrorhamnose reductase